MAPPALPATDQTNFPLEGKISQHSSGSIDSKMYASMLCSSSPPSSFRSSCPFLHIEDPQLKQCQAFSGPLSPGPLKNYGQTSGVLPFSAQPKTAEEDMLHSSTHATVPSDFEKDLTTDSTGVPHSSPLVPISPWHPSGTPAASLQHACGTPSAPQDLLTLRRRRTLSPKPQELEAVRTALGFTLPGGYTGSAPSHPRSSEWKQSQPLGRTEGEVVPHQSGSRKKKTEGCLGAAGGPMAHGASNAHPVSIKQREDSRSTKGSLEQRQVQSGPVLGLRRKKSILASSPSSESMKILPASSLKVLVRKGTSCSEERRGGPGTVVEGARRKTGWLALVDPKPSKAIPKRNSAGKGAAHQGTQEACSGAKAEGSTFNPCPGVTATQTPREAPSHKDKKKQGPKHGTPGGGQSGASTRKEDGVLSCSPGLKVLDAATTVAPGNAFEGMKVPKSTVIPSKSSIWDINGLEMNFEKVRKEHLEKINDKPVMARKEDITGTSEENWSSTATMSSFKTLGISHSAPLNPHLGMEHFPRVFLPLPIGHSGPHDLKDVAAPLPKLKVSGSPSMKPQLTSQRNSSKPSEKKYMADHSDHSNASTMTGEANDKGVCPCATFSLPPPPLAESVTVVEAPFLFRKLRRTRNILSSLL